MMLSTFPSLPRLPAVEHAVAAATRDYNEWRFVWQASWGRVGVAVAVVIAVAVVALGIHGTRRERSRGRRAVLGLLRAGSAMVALLLLLQPAVQLEKVTRIPNHVAVLVDASASMALPERPGGGSRAARAARIVAQAEPAFAAWRERHLVDFYTFGDEGAGEGESNERSFGRSGSELGAIAPTTEDTLRQPTSVRGDSTRIGEALAAVRARYHGHDLGGVVLLSDGIDHGCLGGGNAHDGAPSPETRDFLRSLAVPVHAVWTARPGLRDVAVARVLADDFAFARNAVKVEAVVRVLGGEAWRGQRLPVVLRRDGKAVRTTEIVVDPAQPEQKIAFDFTPDRVGKYLYEIEVAAPPGDAIPENNVHRFVLKVVRDKIRTLLVAGRPSWDERFLRELLKHDPNVDLISFFILRNGDDIDSAPPEEMSLIPFPTDELFREQLKSFDVVFLQNFDYGPYGIGAYLPEIKDYVLSGGGLAMIGGDLSFTSGGYAHTPVADVLPVELREPGPVDQLLAPTPFSMRLTPDGRTHPVTALRLDPTQSLAHWSALPPLEGCNLVARARPGATVLGVHPTLKDRDGKPLPILAVDDMGKGRSLALMADSSWRWAYLTAGAGSDGFEHSYQRFWENAIRWLVRDPELRLLRVESDRGEYRRGEPVRLTVRAFDARYQPAPNVKVTLEPRRVVASDQATQGPALPTLAPKTVVTDEHGVAGLVLDGLPPGGYRVVARATANGQAAGTTSRDEEVFLVRDATRELEDPEARDGVLRMVAAATGGRFLGGDPSTTTLAGLAFREPDAARVSEHRDLELWSSWATLLAGALFLTLEWTLRRRRGLP